MGWYDFTTGITATILHPADSVTNVSEYVSSQTLSGSNCLVLVDCSNGSIIITLPASSSHTQRIYTIKKIDSSLNHVTIDANSTEKIDGELTISLTLQYEYVTIVCDGTEWFIIGGEYMKMEDTLEDIKEVLEDLLEQQEKALAIQHKTGKYIEDMSTEEFEDEEVEEELRDMVVEVKD